MNKPSLLILAAGMGSRYGTLKQMDAFGPNGETIIDYSLYDAIKAGFEKFVFIIRDSFRQEFESTWRQKIGHKAELHFISQEMDILPKGIKTTISRQKPWGTGHAVWVAHNVINEPFGVINADDYYGTSAYQQLYDFLSSDSGQNGDMPTVYAVIAYHLCNTLSENGTVNRGVCQADMGGFLQEVVERIKIVKQEDESGRYQSEDGQWHILPKDTLVSMNMWGFSPSYFTLAETMFRQFLSEETNHATAEFYIPSIIDQYIKSNEIKVKVIDTDAQWFGVTYQEDKPVVMQKIENLISNGTYPAHLWS